MLMHNTNKKAYSPYVRDVPIRHSGINDVILTVTTRVPFPDISFRLIIFILFVFLLDFSSDHRERDVVYRYCTLSGAVFLLDFSMYAGYI